MKCITVFYPSKDNEAFDHEFYRRRHVPLIENILGKSLHKIEVRRGTPARSPRTLPPAKHRTAPHRSIPPSLASGSRIGTLMRKPWQCGRRN